VGGSPGTGIATAFSSVEILDTLVGKWVAGPPLRTARSHLGLASFDWKLFAIAGQDNGAHTDLRSAEVLKLPPNCAAPPPALPPPFAPARKLTVYRVQAVEWAEDIGNADVADIGGMSCYVENFPPDYSYGKTPVMAQYTIEVFTISDDYPNCPDVECPNELCPSSPIRNCTTHYPGERKAGEANCREGASPCNCRYNPASWYGLPNGGECGPADRLGHDCYWRVLSIGAIVPFACIRYHGCGTVKGACPPAVLQAAFEVCKEQQDSCTPTCATCNAALDPYPHASPCNHAGHLDFDPKECDACLQSAHESYGWYAQLAPGRQAYHWACDTNGTTHAVAAPAFFITGDKSDSGGRIGACHCQHRLSVPPPPVP